MKIEEKETYVVVTDLDTGRVIRKDRDPNKYKKRMDLDAQKVEENVILLLRQLQFENSRLRDDNIRLKSSFKKYISLQEKSQ